MPAYAHFARLSEPQRRLLLFQKRKFLVAASALAIACASPAWAQQPYPSRPIELILPAAPGGFLDSMARIVGNELQQSLGTTIVVRNESAGSGVTASNTVASAKPDGYTIGWVQGSQLTMIPHFVKVSFSIDSFAPVSLLYSGPMLFSVGKDIPVHNLKELGEYVRKDGRSFPVGVSAMGGLAHLTAELFSAASGVPTQSVPYRGEAPIILDMRGGNVPAAVTTYNAVAQHAQTGAVRILAVTSERRLPDLPNVPTFKESGYPDVVTTFWHGIVAPAGTPRPIVDKLNQAFA
ncbi:MAG: tripartite tricarboxylate transporter substrate binding protein, partial [Comamonadaceae bacterium]